MIIYDDDEPLLTLGKPRRYFVSGGYNIAGGYVVVEGEKAWREGWDPDRGAWWNPEASWPRPGWVVTYIHKSGKIIKDAQDGEIWEISSTQAAMVKAYCLLHQGAYSLTRRGLMATAQELEE